MSKYHDISNAEQLDKALRQICASAGKKEREIKSSFGELRRESTPLGFASSLFKGGAGALNGAFLAFKLFRVVRRILRRK